MVRQLNKEIDDKVLEIIDYIKNTDSYKNYLKSKEILDERVDLKEIINNVKKIQKDIIKYPKKKKELESELNKNIELLNNDYNYIEYNRYLEEVNNMLNIFENKINNYFNDVFN